ncbi:MAG: hypothetical protein ABIZ49_04600 [Opitutaceae bacterium]
MPDESDPPRKFYRLKPAEFERLNAPVPAPPPGDASETPGTATSATETPRDVREIARLAARGAPPLGVNAPANRPNDVHALLRQNLDRANAAGLNELTPKPRHKSRRKRDYILALILGNALSIIGTAIMPVFGVAGLIIFNVGLTWIMWFVIEDY